MLMQEEKKLLKKIENTRKRAMDILQLRRKNEELFNDVSTLSSTSNFIKALFYRFNQLIPFLENKT
jgi:hypothetical protein